MIIGTCVVEFIVYDANSLKDKRQVVKSIIGKLKSRFNISVAEVDLNDTWRNGVIGFACVTNDTSHANEMISNVLKFIENDARIEVTNADIEIL